MNDKDIPCTGGLIKLQDWHDKKSGRSIPFTKAADWWEVCPAVDDDTLMEGSTRMLPAIFLSAVDGTGMACTFAPADALGIARFLIDYAGETMGAASLAEVERLKDSATSQIFDNAYNQVEEIVRKDLSFEASQIRGRAHRKGQDEGVESAKDLIRKLAMAASLPDASLKKEQLLEECEGQVTRVLAD